MQRLESRCSIPGSGRVSGKRQNIAHELRDLLLRPAERGASAAMTSFLRSFFATILMFFMTGLYCGFRCFRVQGKTLLVCALLGLICQGIYNIFYSLAIVKTGVTSSAVLLNVAPVFASVETVVAALLGAVLYGEWLEPVRLFGIVLVLLSIALLSLRRA